MKRMLICWCMGAVSAFGWTLWMGSDFMVQCGLKLAAMQQTYAYDATPMHVVDEQQVASYLAQAPKGKDSPRRK